MRWSLRYLAIVGTLAVSALAVPAPQAAADSFFFGVSSGQHAAPRRAHVDRRYDHGRYDHGRYDRGRYDRRYYDRGPRFHSGFSLIVPPPVIYAPPRRVVYATPRPVYVPPPEVVYFYPPVAGAAAVAALPSSQVYQAGDGRYCREYQADIVIDGARQRGYGTACQQADGSWQVVN